MNTIDPPDFIHRYRLQVTEAQYELFYNLKDIERFSDNFDPIILNKYKEVMEKMALLKGVLCDYDELLAALEKRIEEIENISIIL